MITLEEMHKVIKLLKKAHPNQVEAIIGYAERIILKNKKLERRRI